MGKKSKSRIDTSGGSLESLSHNPFAALQAEGLPEGEEVPSSDEKETTSQSAPSRPSKKGRVVLRKETAHRGGKTVIVVGDFPPEITVEEMDGLARLIRKRCGCGGGVKEREIEVQGNAVSKIREILSGEGFRVAGVPS